MAPRQRMTPAVDRERQTISTFLLSRGNSGGPSTCALARSRRSCAPSAGGDPAPSCGLPDTSGFTKARPSRCSRHSSPAASAPGPRSTEAVAAVCGRARRRSRRWSRLTPILSLGFGAKGSVGCSARRRLLHNEGSSAVPAVVRSSVTPTPGHVGPVAASQQDRQRRTHLSNRHSGYHSLTLTPQEDRRWGFSTMFCTS